ncbi:hypothetical protein [Pontixanthobacter aquaemixtae]|uniref:Uncharacterized protein n=1 Tax=Pontixanthobacter aquaemixtae TaxID=1958940 RepID=A0A844ZTJ4_9SPHN|nr:hypothetical protein [Pontixanthobacter aquaemixtae]MXO90440.1 hypothetical protein [Pontixanthobacter aquaemixtae]
MTDYQCWFCGEGINQSDCGAVIITIENLWRWNKASSETDAPAQAVFAHRECAKRKLRGQGMEFDPGVFNEDDS